MMDEEELEEYRNWRRELETESKAYHEYCYQVGRFVIEFEKLIYELKLFLIDWRKLDGRKRPDFAGVTGGEVLGIFDDLLGKKRTKVKQQSKEVLRKLYERIDSLNDTRNTVVHSEHVESDEATRKFLLNKVVTGDGSDWEISMVSDEDLFKLWFYMSQATTAIRRMKNSLLNPRGLFKALDNTIPDLPLKLVSRMQKDMFQTKVTSKRKL